MADASLNVKIKADASQAKSAIDQLGKSLHGLQVPAAAFGRTSGLLGNIGSVILGAGGASGALAGALGGAVKASMDFGDAWADVERTVSGTPETLNNLRGQFLQLSNEIPVTATELARIGAIGGQMNIKDDELIGFTKTVAALGRATRMNTEAAAEGIGKLANVTRNRNFEQIATTIVRVGLENVGGESGVMDISERLAPVLTTVGGGVSLPGIAAIGAAVLDTGIEAEMGGSAVSHAFLQMQDAVSSSAGGIVGNIKEVRDAMQHVGDISDDLEIAQMQQGEMYNKRGKLKKQFRQHPSEVRAMDVRIKRLQREQVDAAADLDEKQHPGQKALAAWSAAAGMSGDEFRESFRTDTYGTFRKVIGGLADQKAAGGDIFATMDKMGIKGIRETQTIASLVKTPEHLDQLYNAAKEEYDNAEPGAENPAGFVSALQNARNIKFGTTTAQQQMIKNGANVLAIQTGDMAVPPMLDAERKAMQLLHDTLASGKTIYDILNPEVAGFTNLLGPLKDAFAGLPGPVKDLTVALGLLGAIPLMQTLITGGLKLIAALLGGGAAVAATGATVASAAGPTAAAVGNASIIGATAGVLGIEGVGILVGKLLEGAGFTPITQGEIHPPIGVTPGAAGSVDVGGIHIDMGANIDPQSLIEEAVSRVRAALEAALGSQTTPVSPQMGGAYAQPMHQ